MQARPGFFCKQDIPRSHHILHRICNTGQSELVRPLSRVHHTAVKKVAVFTMRKYNYPKLRRLFHPFLIYKWVHYRFAILAERERTGFRHTGNIREPLPPLSDCNRTDRYNINHGVLRRLIVQILHHYPTINYWICVWHCTDCRKSTCRSRHRPGCNCFLVFKSRFPQMFMQINEPWHHIFSGSIYYAMCFPFNLRRDLRHCFIHDQHVVHAFKPCCRIDHIAPLNQCNHNSSTSAHITQEPEPWHRGYSSPRCHSPGKKLHQIIGALEIS